MSARRWISSLVCLLATATVLTPPSLAGQSGEDAGDRKRIKIGEHRFVGNPLTADALPRTYISQDLGIGQATDIEFLPAFVIGEDTIQAISGDLLFSTLNFEYQHRVKDWLGVFVKADLVARLGTDVGALLSEGATVLTGFELGWVIRLIENEKVGLSATANVWNNSFTGVNLFEWVEGIVDDEPVDLVRKTPSVRGGGGLRFAWAGSDLVGVSARTELGLGESVARRDEDQVSFKLAGALDLDFHQRFSVPLGLVLGVEFNNSPREGSELTDKANRGLVRVAYTGREDFLLALDFGGSRLSFTRGPDGEEPSDISAGSIGVRMKYFF